MLQRFQELMDGVVSSHAPDFVALDVTMAQTKALYVIAAAGSLHISALAERLGVTLSTGSGLVERLVDQGLVERRHDDADRRHVVVRLTDQGSSLLERMRELNTCRMRSMLGAVDDDDLAALGRVLVRFIDHVHAEQAAVDASADPPTVTPMQEGTP